MSNTLAEGALTAGLEEERQDLLSKDARLFRYLWQQALPTLGQIKLGVSESLFLSIRQTEGDSRIFVANHEYRNPEVTGDGRLVEVPVATKYALYVEGDISDERPVAVAEIDQDLSLESEISRKIFDLTDTEYGWESEKVIYLRRQHASHKYLRDRTLPEKPLQPTVSQLTTALHLSQLLGRAREVQPGQNLEARMQQGFSED